MQGNFKRDEVIGGIGSGVIGVVVYEMGGMGIELGMVYNSFFAGHNFFNIIISL